MAGANRTTSVGLIFVASFPREGRVSVRSHGTTFLVTVREKNGSRRVVADIESEELASVLVKHLRGK